MDEIKVNALNEEVLNEVSGGTWQPRGCKGYVIGIESHKSAWSDNTYTCNVYKVAYGDTLSQIAMSLSNGDYGKLAKFNGIPNPNLIRIDQLIYVPIGAYNP